MEKLLKNKFEAVVELKNFTKEISAHSVKTEYDKVNSMIEERQQYIKKINGINEEINKATELCSSFTESDEIKNLRKEIREVLKETVEMDNLIRKNISNELKSVKNILNQPEKSKKMVNIKA